MKKKHIGFSIYQFILGGKQFTITDFDLKIPEGFEKEKIGEDVVGVRKVVKEFTDERFVKFYFESGDRYPYSSKVIDVDEDKEKDNPRESSLVELDAQLFVLFDIKTQRIYLSDQRMKTFLINWFNNWFAKTVTIKALIDKGDFLDKIDKIREISFSAEPNLLLQTNTLGKHLMQDIYGFGATDMKVDLTYKNGKNLCDELKSKITNLINNKSILKDLTVTGRTDEKLESILNMDEVINKIGFSLAPDETTKKFHYIEVFCDLIDEIKLNEE